MEWLLSPLAALPELVSWRAVVDLLLLSGGVYFGYRALRTLGAQKLVWGLGLVGALLVFSSLLQLRGTEWILVNVSQIAFVALIVLFQPEIRRILESATRLRTLKRNQQPSKLPYLVDEVAFALAARKWGAVIVLPGEDLIQRWTSEGIPLDAIPSFPLLVSLFDPNSPGHDGAVVLENGRISRFGVRLPLSQTGKLGKDFGTRHAAGLGLSESSDALAVVVSEERSEITVFERGQSDVVKTKGGLASHILSHTQGERHRTLIPKAQRPAWIRIIEVIASVAVGFVFWSTVVLTQTKPSETSLSVPIEFANAPDQLALVEPQNAQARVRISATAATLSTLDRATVGLVVDLANLGPGRQTVALLVQDVRLPRKIRVLSVEPQSLDVLLEAKEEIELAIEPQLVGSPPEGWVLASATVHPARISVLAIAASQPPIVQHRLLTTPIHLGTLQRSATIVGKVLPTRGVEPLAGKWPDLEIHVVLRREGE